MPGYTDEQHKRFYDKHGRWHYGAPEYLKKAKPYDPSAAQADSVAVSKERVASGTAAAPDTLRLRMARVPGFEAPKEKPYDPSDAIQDSIAALILRGDTAGAAKLRPTAPPAPSYSMREINGPDGKPALVWVNNRTREIRPVGGGYTPATSKADATRMRPISDVTKKFTDTVENSDEIMSASSLLDMEKEKYPAGSPVRVAAENRSRAAEDSLSIATNAERMGYADFNEAAADLKNLEDTYAEYVNMEKRLGRDKAVAEFTRINGKHPAQVKQMIYNFRRPLTSR